MSAAERYRVIERCAGCNELKLVRNMCGFYWCISCSGEPAPEVAAMVQAPKVNQPGLCEPDALWLSGWVPKNGGTGLADPHWSPRPAGWRFIEHDEDYNPDCQGES